MLAEFLREAAVLIFVFAPLEQALRGHFTVKLESIGMGTAALMLALGIWLEKRRNP